MAHFRVTTTDGRQHRVRARWVRRHGDELAFCERRHESVRTVETMPVERVTALSRRIVELNGLERWITEPLPEPAAPHAPLQRR